MADNAERLVADDPSTWCAYDGCAARGLNQVCYADGRYHNHGRVHYDHDLPEFRARWEIAGWLRLCNEHYEVARAQWEQARA